MDLVLPDVEAGVISALSNTAALDAARALALVRTTQLRPDDFGGPLRDTYAAMVRLLEAGESVTPLSVEVELKRALPGVGKAMLVAATTALMDPTHDAPSVAGYARTLKDLSLRRTALAQLAETRAALMDGKLDPGAAVATLTGRLSQTAARGASIASLKTAAEEVLAHLDRVNSGQEEAIIPTGIKALDAVIGGLQPTLTLLGALPGVGKSAWIATVSQHLARKGKRVGILSLEDAPAWMLWRLLSDEARVDQFVLRYKRLTDAAWQATGDGFARLSTYLDNLFVVDGSDGGLNIESVINACHSLVLVHGVEAIIVDHLGEIAGSGDEVRYDMEVSKNLSRLRGVANRFGVPVVVAAHFRRREGLGPGDMPRLSDFANSSGAERKARVALGLSREPDSDTMTIHVLKNTNGKAGHSVEVEFVGAAAMLRAEGTP